MHELSIASEIIDAVRREAEQRPGVRVTKVGVRIGILAGVVPDALSFGFETLVKGTDLDPLELVIESVPRRQRCASCDFTFEVTESGVEGPGSKARNPESKASDFGLRTPDFGLSLACPRCGSTDTLFAGGDELDIAYLEVED